MSACLSRIDGLVPRLRISAHEMASPKRTSFGGAPQGYFPSGRISPPSCANRTTIRLKIVKRGKQPFRRKAKARKICPRPASLRFPKSDRLLGQGAGSATWNRNCRKPMHDSLTPDTGSTVLSRAEPQLAPPVGSEPFRCKDSPGQRAPASPWFQQKSTTRFLPYAACAGAACRGVAHPLLR